MTEGAKGAVRVLVDADEPARGRYPSGNILGPGRRWFQFEPPRAGGAPGPTYDVEIVDRAEVEPGGSRPAAVSLLAVDVLLSLAEKGSTVWPGPWTVYTPFSDCADVGAAASGIRSGRLGGVEVAVITVAVGHPVVSRHDLDWYFPTSPGEALYMAVHLAEHLCGGEVLAIKVIGRHSGETLWHAQLDGNIDVVVRLVNAAVSSVRGFAAELRGDEGRVVVRPEFGYGALAWQRGGEGVEFHAVANAKDTTQHPDTVRGGWEIFAAVTRGLEQPVPSSSSGAGRLASHVVRVVASAGAR